MRILFNIGHPAQVHLFKNLVWELEKRGHECVITIIDKDVSIHLLDAYGFKYEIVGRSKPSPASKAFEMALIELRLLRIAREFKPDMLIGGVGNVYVAHVGWMINRPSLVLDDTEHAKLDHLLMDSFVGVILTPSCFNNDLGPKQIRFNGYKEIASLHPNYFTPDPSVLDDAGLSEVDPLIIVRFVSWQANHDLGQHGIQDKVGLVKKLEQYGKVLITSEGPLPEELERNRIKVSPEKLHHLLYYAILYVGEGASTASECAVLGTHAIYVNSLSLGYISEEDKRYGLVSDFSKRVCTDETVISEARKLLENKDLKKEGKLKGERIIREKIDVTAFMLWFVENYPKSFDEMSFQERNPSEGLAIKS